MRLLVLDENQLLAWMVERLAPPGTEVVAFTSFDDARRALLENPPDAAVVCVTAAHLPWREFGRLCAGRRPPVPVLFESCVFSSAEEAGLEADSGEVRFLRTPASRGDLKDALARLLKDAHDSGERPVFEARSL